MISFRVFADAASLILACLTVTRSR